jgi:hypothetical protein
METHNSLYHLQRVYYVQWQTRTAVLGGMWLLGTGGTCDCYSLDVTILGKAAVLHFTLTPFCSWGCANPACKLFDIAVLVSRSHRFLILHSPYSHIWVKPQGFFFFVVVVVLLPLQPACCKGTKVSAPLSSGLSLLTQVCWDCANTIKHWFLASESCVYLSFPYTGPISCSLRNRGVGCTSELPKGI